MGEGMFVHIAKGSVHKKVDATLNHKAGGAFDKRAGFLAALGNAATVQGYLTVLRNPQLMTPPLTQVESDYLRDTWYSQGPDGWWPWLQPIYAILRQGLIKAIEVATAKNLPIDSYWLPVGNQVEVIVTALPGAQQVTRLILTPPGLAPTVARLNPIDIWSIRRSLGRVVGNFTSEEVVESVIVQDNVVTWQQKEV